jgi:hypothetical protein
MYINKKILERYVVLLFKPGGRDLNNHITRNEVSAIYRFLSESTDILRVCLPTSNY